MPLPAFDGGGVSGAGAGCSDAPPDEPPDDAPAEDPFDDPPEDPADDPDGCGAATVCSWAAAVRFAAAAAAASCSARILTLAFQFALDRDVGEALLLDLPELHDLGFGGLASAARSSRVPGR